MYYQIMTSDGLPFGLGMPVENPHTVMVDSVPVIMQMFYYFPPDKTPNIVKKFIDFNFMVGKFYYLCFPTFYPPLVQGTDTEYLLADFYEGSCFNNTLFNLPISERLVYAKRWASDNLLEFIKDNFSVDGRIVDYNNFINRSKAVSGVQKLLDEAVLKLRKTIPESVVSVSMRNLNSAFDEAQRQNYAINFIPLESDNNGNGKILDTEGEPKQVTNSDIKVDESTPKSSDSG